MREGSLLLLVCWDDSISSDTISSLDLTLTSWIISLPLSFFFKDFSLSLSDEVISSETISSSSSTCLVDDLWLLIDFSDLLAGSVPFSDFFCNLSLFSLTTSLITSSVRLDVFWLGVLLEVFSGLIGKILLLLLEVSSLVISSSITDSERISESVVLWLWDLTECSFLDLFETSLEVSETISSLIISSSLLLFELSSGWFFLISLASSTIAIDDILISIFKISGSLTHSINWRYISLTKISSSRTVGEISPLSSWL